jgi:hypothetical protein
MAIEANSKLKDQYGWAAKFVNIYLKTYCYIGDGGREGIRDTFSGGNLLLSIMARFYQAAG